MSSVTSYLWRNISGFKMQKIQVLDLTTGNDCSIKPLGFSIRLRKSSQCLQFSILLLCVPPFSQTPLHCTPKTHNVSASTDGKPKNARKCPAHNPFAKCSSLCERSRLLRELSILSAGAALYTPRDDTDENLFPSSQ